MALLKRLLPYLMMIVMNNSLSCLVLAAEGKEVVVIDAGDRRNGNIRKLKIAVDSPRHRATSTEKHAESSNLEQAHHHSLMLPPRDDPYIEFSTNAIDTYAMNPCGLRKCLFRAKMTTTTGPPSIIQDGISTVANNDNNYNVASNSPKIGFLVTGYKDSTYEHMMNAWYLLKDAMSNKRIAGTHQPFRHIYLSAPQIINSTSNSMMINVDADVPTNDEYSLGQWLDQQNNRFVLSSTIGAPRFSGKDSFLVQEVNVIDQHDSLILGCYARKVHSFWWNVEHKYLHTLRERTSLWERKIIAKTLEAQAVTLFETLDECPCLFYDFQIFLSPNGELIHFDVERCFESKRKIGKSGALQDKCRTTLSEMIEFVISSLQSDVPLKNQRVHRN